MINKRLAEEQGLSDETVAEINIVNDKLAKVLEEPYLYVSTPDKVNNYIQNIEYYLQELWGFPESDLHHRYWYKVKWCECPVMDNDDHFGYGFRLIQGTCPYHGWDNATTWNDERFGDNE